MLVNQIQLDSLIHRLLILGTKTVNRPIEESMLAGIVAVTVYMSKCNGSGTKSCAFAE